MRKNIRSITIPTTGRNQDLAIGFYHLARQLDLDVAKLGRRAILLLMAEHGAADGKTINASFLQEAKAALAEGKVNGEPHD